MNETLLALGGARHYRGKQCGAHRGSAVRTAAILVPPQRRAASMTTVSVRHAVHELMAFHGMSTIFGNPGSNELPFLKDLPAH